MQKLCDEAKAGIVAWYKEGMPSTFLAKVYDASQGQVLNILHKESIKMRNPANIRRLNLNEEVFDEINEESAYWLGFLISDGCVRERKNSYEIALKLQKGDKEHLEKFKKFLESEHKISLSGGKDYLLAFNSRRLGEKLISYGIVPHKGKNGCECNKGLANNKHFWRGVIDGDGSLGVYKRGESLNLTGSYKLLNQFLSYVKTICNTKSNVTKDRNTFRVVFGYDKAKFLVKHFYKDATVYLERKMQVAQGVIDYHRRIKKIEERGINRKLTKENVRFIKNHRDVVSGRKLAKMFGVSKTAIAYILQGKTWQYIQST